MFVPVSPDWPMCSAVAISPCVPWRMSLGRSISSRTQSISKQCLSLFPSMILFSLIMLISDDHQWSCRNLTKEWSSRYERLSSMVVPRSSTWVHFHLSYSCRDSWCHLITLHRQIASDDEYTLFSVVIFRRIHDEFVQRCRENKSVLHSSYASGYFSSKVNWA